MQIIDDLNTTIERLFEKEFGEPLPFDISFGVPQRDFSPVSNSKPTINFYLYDIRKNKQLYSNEPLIQKQNNGSVIRKQPPERIQLSYCVTAWSPAEEDAMGTRTREEHKQLSKALIGLIKHPVIPKEVLAGSLVGQEPPLQTTVAQPDDMENLAQFWNAIDGVYKPFLDYRVTISLDYHEWMEGKMVATIKSALGSISWIYRVSIQPHTENVYPDNNKIFMGQVVKGPAIYLLNPAAHNHTKIQIPGASDMAIDDWIMFVDRERTEFGQIGSIETMDIHLKSPLLFNHEAGTELKKVSKSNENPNIFLAGTSPKKAKQLFVKGSDAHTMKPGMIITLEQSGLIGFFRVDQISGPEIGIGDADHFIRLAGFVTNSAMSPAPVVGAKVTLLDNQGIYITESLTDVEGRYCFKQIGLATRKFILKAEAVGYETVENIIEDINQTRMEDFMIKI